MPYISISKSTEPYTIYAPGSRNVTIKHDSYFNLTCQSGKFKSFVEKIPREITVKCLEGQSVQYKQYAYEYDYFECDDTQRMMAARKAFRKIFIPKTRKTRPIRKLYITVYKYIFIIYLIIFITLNIQKLSHNFK